MSIAVDRSIRPTLWRERNFLLALVLAVAVGWPADGKAQATVDTTLWVTDGWVYSVVRSGDTVYLGGGFSRVGPATGIGAPLEVASGLPPAGFPKVCGLEIRAVCSDGSGGWYIGGLFRNVGGFARSNLAHIRADGSVASWNPAPNGEVWALLMSGGTLYVCGIFTEIGGETRNHLAAVDATTGTTTAWNPAPNSFVGALAAGESTVYAGGAFTSIGGQSRRYLAALDPTTGTATPWDPWACPASVDSS